MSTYKFKAGEKPVITVRIEGQQPNPLRRGLILPEDPIDFLKRRVAAQTGMIPFFFSSGGVTEFGAIFPTTFNDERFWIHTDDLAMMFLESNASVAVNEAGWSHAPGSPIVNGSTRLSVFYKFIEPGEPDVSFTTSSDHINGALLIFRGVDTSNPFNAYGTTFGSGNLFFTPDITTTVQNTLVINSVSSTRDDDAFDNFTFVNPAVTFLTEIWDAVDDTASGGGVGVATGEMAAPTAITGSFCATTTNEAFCAWNAALTPSPIKRPYIVGDNTFPEITYRTNDIIIGLVETMDEDFVMPTGFSHAPDSPVSNAGTNPTRLSVIWKRCSTDLETNPVISSSGLDHIIQRYAAVRGCVESGNPFNVTSFDTGTGDAVTIPGATTTVNNCLVLAAVATTYDPGGFLNFALWEDWANADLDNIVAQEDFVAGDGEGGGVAMADGLKATAGAYGDTTVSQTGAMVEWAGWTGALKPKV